MSGPRFLLVEDDPSLATAVARKLGRLFPCTVAGSICEARIALTTEPGFCGFIIDLRLPDGSGLDILREARRRHVHAPAVLLTATIEGAVINETYDLGASFVAKPIGPKALERFVEEANACAQGLDLRTQRRIADAVAQFALSAGERDVLVAKLAAVPREVFITDRSVSLNTYKTQVRTLIGKLGVESLEDARRLLLGGELTAPPRPRK